MAQVKRTVKLDSHYYLKGKKSMSGSLTILALFQTARLLRDHEKLVPFSDDKIAQDISLLAMAVPGVPFFPSMTPAIEGPVRCLEFKITMAKPFENRTFKSLAIADLDLGSLVSQFLVNSTASVIDSTDPPRNH